MLVAKTHSPIRDEEMEDITPVHDAEEAMA